MRPDRVVRGVGMLISEVIDVLSLDIGAGVHGPLSAVGVDSVVAEAGVGSDGIADGGSSMVLLWLISWFRISVIGWRGLRSCLFLRILLLLLSLCIQYESG